MKDIRLLVLDVDGTLTDGKIYMGAEGEVCKAFSIKDGLGLRLMADSGVTLAILTGRESRIVQNRAAELKIPHVIQNVQNKPEALRRLCQELSIPLEETGFVGDDLIDLEAMRLCGLSVCPCDAAKEVKAQADFVSELPGGSGAVRQFVECYLEERGLWAPLAARRFGVKL